VLSWMFLSVLMSVMTLAIAFKRRDAPKSRYYLLLTLAITMYNLGRAFESAATNLEAAYYGVILAYVGLPYIPLLMLLFLLDYYDLKVNNRLLLPLWIPLLLTSVFVTVPGLRHIYYAAYSFVPAPPIAQIVVEASPFYYAMFVYHILLNVVCLSLSVWGAAKSGKAERLSSLVVFAAVLLPMLGEILYVLRLTPMQLEIAPIAMCFSVALLSLAVHRFNLLRILPMAKDAVLEQMSDALIIVDLESRYLEANAAAKKRFPTLSDMQIGQKLDIAELFPGMVEALDGKTLVSMQKDGTQRYYHLSETIIDQDAKTRCICYTLHDVTDTRKLLAELKSMATYDALTNIYNRASFYQLATHELERAHGQRTPVSAFGIDIDCFKQINDTYGHFCGDAVLRSIVGKIAGRLRGADIFGRVGGDEFSIFLPNTPKKNAALLAEDLQRMVAEEPIMYENQAVAVTISIGVAAYDKDRHAKLEDLLLDVDSALYESKSAGRNMVSVYRADD
jgi:diguanylate cyclase (GGDEF) domain